MGKIGMIPAEDAATIRAAYDRDALGEIDIEAIDAIEAVTKHDVIAFLTWAGEKLGPERRWLHQGMTSSDVLDTTLAVQLKQSAELLLKDIDALLEVLKRRAVEHKLTPTIGRSHGIHAEPTTFGPARPGLCRVHRNRGRLAAARDTIATCAISGSGRDVRQRSALGRSAYCGGAGPERRARLDPVPRDRHAAFFATLGVIASSIERLATEIATSSAPKCLRRRNISRPGRRAARPCRTSAIPF